MGKDDLPPVGRDGARHWQVAGGIIRKQDSVLVVENLRRNGSRDWSTPGGVVDPGETSIEGLTREVLEETGLRVDDWNGPVYQVEVNAVDAGFVLNVDAFEAVTFSGTIKIDDPDGIVIGAEFIDLADVDAHMDSSTVWVVEPLVEFLNAAVPVGHVFRYTATGRRDNWQIERTS